MCNHFDLDKIAEQSGEGKGEECFAETKGRTHEDAFQISDSKLRM
jgi:hypothetical protein